VIPWVLKLAKASLTSLLMFASLVLGLGGAGWVAEAVVTYARGGESHGFPFGAVWGLVAIAAGWESMRMGRRLARREGGRDRASA